MIGISVLERDRDSMPDQAMDMYKDMIEVHPDRYMRGTRRADIAWNYSTDVGKLLSDFGRAFIGKFDPEIQEKIAYKNAGDIIAKYDLP